MSYVFLLPVLIPLVLCTFLGEHVPKSIHTSHSSGTMLDGGYLASHNSHHAGRHSPLVSHHRSYHKCFGRPGAQGSAIAAFNPLAAQRCVL